MSESYLEKTTFWKVITIFVVVVMASCSLAYNKAENVNIALQEHKDIQNEELTELKISVTKNTVYLENLIEKLDKISNALNGK